MLIAGQGASVFAYGIPSWVHGGFAFQLIRGQSQNSLGCWIAFDNLPFCVLKDNALRGYGHGCLELPFDRRQLSGS
jgi:hypothetical protein